MNKAVVSLGSNLEPEENIRAALERLAEDHRLCRVSPLLQTTPIGPVQDQPDFLNGAALVETALTFEAFAASLKDIEQAFGRDPGGDRWGPREVDLDVVVWNGRVVDDNVHRRDFLAESVAAVGVVVIP